MAPITQEPIELFWNRQQNLTQRTETYLQIITSLTFINCLAHSSLLYSLLYLPSCITPTCASNNLRTIYARSKLITYLNSAHRNEPRKYHFTQFYPLFLTLHPNSPYTENTRRVDFWKTRNIFSKFLKFQVSIGSNFPTFQKHFWKTKNIFSKFLQFQVSKVPQRVFGKQEIFFQNFYNSKFPCVPSFQHSRNTFWKTRNIFSNF